MIYYQPINGLKSKQCLFMAFFSIWLRRIKNYCASFFTEYSNLNDDNSMALEEVNFTEEIPVIPELVEPIPTRRVLAEFIYLVFSRENLPRISLATVMTLLGTGVNFLSPYLFAKTIEALSNEEDSVEFAGVQEPTQPNELVSI